MTPQRIQLRRTKGWRMPSHTIKVCRPTPWGNPFRAINPANPDQAKKAVHYFRQWISGAANSFDCGPEHGVTMAFIPPWNRPGNLRAKLQDLRGRNLACWCKPGSPCHADVLLELAKAAGAE